MTTSPRGSTTTTDIRALRTMAAQGVSMTEAARQLGMSLWMVSYWNRRQNLGFKRPGADTRAARTLAALSAAVASDLAIARLSRTVERVAAASGGERQ